jgi:hypothetical protein
MIWLGCDTLVSVGKYSPLVDNSTDPPTPIVGGATVSGVLKDKDGNVLGGTVNFSYVAGTTGQWDGTVTDTHTGIVLNMRGTIEVTADAGSGKKMLAELNFLVANYQGEV